MALLASFFHPSASLTNMYIHVYIYNIYIYISFHMYISKHFVWLTRLRSEYISVYSSILKLVREAWHTHNTSRGRGRGRGRRRRELKKRIRCSVLGVPPSLPSCPPPLQPLPLLLTMLDSAWLHRHRFPIPSRQHYSKLLSVASETKLFLTRPAIVSLTSSRCLP